jgi:twinkle protein
MLQAGRGEELAKTVMFRAKAERNDGVKKISDYMEDILKKPTMGYSWPWPLLNRPTFGIRKGCIHIIGAAPKIGKSEHHHTLVEHLADKCNERVGVFDLENRGDVTSKLLISKFAKKPFLDPDVKYEDSELIEAADNLEDKIRLYDSDGRRDWGSIKEAVRSMNIIDSINYFFIDNLTVLVASLDSSSANDKLNEILSDCRTLCQELDITFFLYSHVNPKKGNQVTHNHGGRVFPEDFTGSRAMEKWANFSWGLVRNKYAGDSIERNTLIVTGKPGYPS